MKQLALVIALVALMFGIMAAEQAWELKSANTELQRQAQELKDVRNDLGYCQGTMR